MFEHEEYPPDSDEDIKRVVESDEEEDEYSSAGEEEESEEEGEEESEDADEGKGIYLIQKFIFPASHSNKFPNIWK